MSRLILIPELLTLKGMVCIIFNTDQEEQSAGNDAPLAECSNTRKRSHDALHSCDLWHLQDGATDHKCLERVCTITEARRAKAAAVANTKQARSQLVQERLDSQLRS